MHSEGLLLSVCVSLSLSVCLSICLSARFPKTVAVVDTKRGYMGMCNGRSAQQESGAALNSVFTGGG